MSSLTWPSEGALVQTSKGIPSSGADGAHLAWTVTLADASDEGAVAPGYPVCGATSGLKPGFLISGAGVGLVEAVLVFAEPSVCATMAQGCLAGGQARFRPAGFLLRLGSTTPGR